MDAKKLLHEPIENFFYVVDIDTMCVTRLTLFDSNISR